MIGVVAPFPVIVICMFMSRCTAHFNCPIVSKKSIVCSNSSCVKLWGTGKSESRLRPTSRQSVAQSRTLEHQNSAHGSVVSFVHVGQNSSLRQCLEKLEMQGHHKRAHGVCCCTRSCGTNFIASTVSRETREAVTSILCEKSFISIVVVGPTSSPRMWSSGSDSKSKS